MHQIIRILFILCYLIIYSLFISCKNSNTVNVFYNGDIAVHEVNASSYLDESHVKHLPDHTIDDDNETCWTEGTPGPGIGEWLQFKFKDELHLKEIKIKNGFQREHPRYGNLYYKNNRPEKVTVQTDTGQKTILILRDKEGVQNFKVNFEKIKSVKLIIQSVYKGTKWDDTCLSDIEFWGRTKHENALKRTEYKEKQQNDNNNQHGDTNIEVIVAKGGEETKRLFEGFKELLFDFSPYEYRWSSTEGEGVMIRIGFGGHQCFHWNFWVFKKHFTKDSVDIYVKDVNTSSECIGKDCTVDYPDPQDDREIEAKCGDSYTETIEIHKYTVTRKSLEKMKIENESFGGGASSELISKKENSF